MGIIRTGVVLAGVVAALPVPPEDARTRLAAPEASYFSAATGTVSDVAGFCGRQPMACEVGGYIAAKLELKAKYGARLIYAWANDGQPAAAPAPRRDKRAFDVITTGSTTVINKTPPPPRPTQSTLKLEDVIPVWLGPVHHNR
jgi:hypothetical protein